MIWVQMTALKSRWSPSLAKVEAEGADIGGGHSV